DTRIFSPLLYQLSYGTIGHLPELRVQKYYKLFIPTSPSVIFFYFFSQNAFGKPITEEEFMAIIIKLTVFSLFNQRQQ
ncbi:MAG: hypothetical protein NC229_06855, partial [Bacteroides sp.]|nr:hypothetical protein [Bacteroides sp.]MCM1403532.1 hypothetical protein [Bacteroides sp.]MCM1443171.1 hypothetical protein [Muribaculum sp.]